MITDPIYNALIGLAVGDSAGYPFEFSENPLPEDVLFFAKRTNKVISDDTQMTLFGFEAVKQIIAGYDPEIQFIEAYKMWYETQVEFNLEPIGHILNDSRFMRIRRAPGATCLRAMMSHWNGRAPNNDSCGCGQVMRLLPVMAAQFDLEECKRLGRISCDVTHLHPENHIASDLLITSYYQLMNTGQLMHSDTDIDEATNITDLGEGWTALSAVKMAIWAYVNSKTFDELLVHSICHRGDSDSVAAIAGSLWGIAGNKVEYDQFLERTLIDEYYGI